MKNLSISCCFVLLLLFGSEHIAILFAQVNLTPKGMQQMRQQQNMERRMIVSQELQKREWEKNVRSLCFILGDTEVQEKLRVNAKQKEQLEELNNKYRERYEKVINPKGTPFANPGDRRESIQKNFAELNVMTLSAGKAVMEILSPNQVNEYGNKVMADRAERQWESRMGIQPGVLLQLGRKEEAEKNEKQNNVPKATPQKNAK
ncbi:MAG: hypothetical protein ACRCUY_12205 [Thermoguttaceae bacterium]